MIPIIHSIIILLAYVSPFLIEWKIVLGFIFLYYIQLFVFGNCILTLAQFKEDTRDTTFYSYLFAKLGFNPKKTTLRIIVDYCIPWVILLFAIFWQIYLNHTVMIDFK